LEKKRRRRPVMLESESEKILLEEPSRSNAQTIIAALNEEEGIGPTIKELERKLQNLRIIVVDGYSHDRTVEIAKNSGAQILFQEGTGKGDAICTALKHLDPEAKFVVLTDADFTYPAESIPEMIEILENNPEVGMVCGNRFSCQKEEGAWKNAFFYGNKLIAFAHSLLNGVMLEDPLTGLRVIRTGILRNVELRSKGFDIEVELNHQVLRKGYRTVEIPIRYRPRLGEKKLQMKHGVSILKRIFLESYR
jgi:dolichol-phosphate hexosyltransferase